MADTQAGIRAEDLARQVDAMALPGALRLVVADAAAIWGEGDGAGAAPLAEAILRKLGLLARREGPGVAVAGTTAAQREALRRAVPSERLSADERGDPADAGARLREAGVAPGECLALLAHPGARAPEGCRAYYVGRGAPPAGARPTRLLGPAAGDLALALYGTALAQERAGHAFRNTSAGRPIPREAPFSTAVWEGIARSVGRPPAAPLAPRRVLPDDAALRALAARAYERLLRNVLPNGAVVASPAHGERPGEPNYWFYWQRDGAAAMGHLIAWQRRAPLGLDTRGLAPLIARYLDFLAATQRHGHLGTSRYSVEGEPILGFGNPQLDGPPLTVLTLARLADPAPGYGPARTYLDYLLGDEGGGRTMDAWEFIYGRFFNGEFLKRCALLAGAAMADRLGRDADAARFRAGAAAAGDRLGDFLDAANGRLLARRETLNPWFEALGGLDASVLGALLHGADVPPEPSGAAPGGASLGLAHPAVLATQAALEDAFADLYQVNRDWTAGGNAGWGIGRFPEDANDGLGSSGGNPWPLSTLWAAQFYYQLVRQLAATPARSGSVPALDDPRQAAFFNRAAGSEVAAPGRPPEAAAWRARILPALLARGDAFLGFVIHHMPEDGGVTEQVDRETGRPRGAPALSWALAELIATLALREEALGR